MTRRALVKSGEGSGWFDVELEPVEEHVFRITRWATYKNEREVDK